MSFIEKQLLGHFRFYVRPVTDFFFPDEVQSTPAPVRGTHRPSSTRGRPYYPSRSRSTTPATTSSTSTTPAPSRKAPSSNPELPATVKETIQRKSSIGLQKPASSPAVNDAISDHPQDNEISGSGVDNREAAVDSGVPEPSGPIRVNSADQPTHQAKLHLGAVIALGVFGGFVFLAAVITTVVILIRR